MLAIILKILSILGILLLILLGVVLLVLFFPIGYYIDGVKKPQTTYLKIKVRWLFGLFRGGAVYPKPGRWIVKGFWFTLFDSEAEPDKKRKASKEKANDTGAEEVTKETGEGVSAVEEQENGQVATQDTRASIHGEDIREAEPEQEPEAEEQGAKGKKSATRKEKLFAKYEKIKYTIKKFYDKIKHILNEISFYKNLLQDEETKLLFSHACKRIGKVLRHIKPRKLKSNVIFGTGAPDTTGYVFAFYGMLSPRLGKDVCITPDFTEQILEGTFYAKGHITVFTILVNVCALVLDKRLKLLERRIKNHVKITERHGN